MDNKEIQSIVAALKNAPTFMLPDYMLYMRAEEAIQTLQNQLEEKEVERKKLEVMVNNNFTAYHFECSACKTQNLVNVADVHMKSGEASAVINKLWNWMMEDSSNPPAALRAMVAPYLKFKYCDGRGCPVCKPTKELYEEAALQAASHNNTSLLMEAHKSDKQALWERVFAVYVKAGYTTPGELVDRAVTEWEKRFGRQESTEHS